MTRAQIQSLTMADVAAAKLRVIENRKTRRGSRTVDFVLSQVDGNRRTLALAKRVLLNRLERESVS